MHDTSLIKSTRVRPVAAGRRFGAEPLEPSGCLRVDLLNQLMVQQDHCCSSGSGLPRWRATKSSSTMLHCRACKSNAASSNGSRYLRTTSCWLLGGQLRPAGACSRRIECTVTYPEITTLHTATTAGISATANALVMPSFTHHAGKPGYPAPSSALGPVTSSAHPMTTAHATDRTRSPITGTLAP